jgi:C4-dicarboxylate transporter DctQ subunit
MTKREITALLERLNIAMTYFEVVFAGSAIAFASLLLFTNVVLRYIFLSPISWAEELSIYIMIWIVFVAGSGVFRNLSHLKIDLLPQVLTPVQRRYLLLFSLLVVMAFLAVFIYYSGLHTMRVYSSGQRTPNMLAPMWLTYLAMPVGSSMMFVRSLLAFYTISIQQPDFDKNLIQNFE